MRKLIGLTGPSSFTDECKQLIEQYFQENYILLYHENMDNLKYWLSKCDAFIVAGGVDIHPTVYERDVTNHNNLSKFDFQRDLRELVVINYALENKKPMLGICRGHQMIGLVHGVKSDFCMDLCNVTTVHQPMKSNVTANKGDVMHFLELINPKAFSIPEPPEREILREVMGEDQGKFFWVNSFHHQGIIYNPKSFPYKDRGIQVLGIASAQSPKDKESFKIVELMRGENWISCQWHPEWDYDVNTPSKTVVDTFHNMLRG